MITHDAWSDYELWKQSSCFLMPEFPGRVWGCFDCWYSSVQCLILIYWKHTWLCIIRDLWGLVFFNIALHCPFDVSLHLLTVRGLMLHGFRRTLMTCHCFLLWSCLFCWIKLIIQIIFSKKMFFLRMNWWRNPESLCAPTRFIERIWNVRWQSFWVLQSMQIPEYLN